MPAEGFARLRVCGSMPFFRDMMVMAASMAPAAPSKWPRAPCDGGKMWRLWHENQTVGLDMWRSLAHVPRPTLQEETGTCSPKTSRMALASMASPKGVEVACALT